ncbi:MAG: MOSC domain-containing protein [Acidobacteria bacterium]|nr:MOSC domain-containing protein [Acidobacteriota bacterium]
MEGQILQLSISKGGVPKLPVLSGEVGPVGIVGDVQQNTKYHGGPRQALLWITAEGLEELKAEGFPVYPGALGENVTTTGINRRTVRLGQQWRMGEVIVEVTKMREPCYKLDPYGPGIQKAVFDTQVKSGDFTSSRWGLAGFYLAIVKLGLFAPGDPVTLLTDVA